MNASTCRTCKAPVLWARTRSNRAIPLDPDPRADGNLVVHLGVAMDPEAAPLAVRGGPRFVAHFTTCPQAAEHRRPR